MFDIVGRVSLRIHDLALPELGEAFSGELWQRETHRRSVVEGNGFRVLCLHRRGEPEDHASADGRHLFLVGEAFPRFDVSQMFDGREGKLRVSELLRAYTELGPRLVRTIKGNYTIIVIDEEQRRASIYNNRFGISPFYYAWDGQHLAFSTSLVALARSLPKVPEVDPVAVAELTLFNYPLGTRSYFKGIQMLRPAEVVRATAEDVERELWWDVRTLYDVPSLAEDEALETGSTLFYRTVNNLACDMPQICASFTSGFDSRAILAVLEKDLDQVLTYAFGIPGSLNVSIPEQISARLGFQFLPIYLEEGYERVFDEYAFQAMLYTDNLSTVERANFPYAYEKLASFSSVVITGLFGSELMRTFQNVGLTINANLVRLNSADDPPDELRALMTAPGAAGYFADGLIAQVQEEIEADVATTFIRPFADMPPDRRFYMFLLTEGLRKYFGAEIHMERPYATSRFPFLDDEFVEFLFRAPFAGVYSRTLRPTVANRFRSQYFYAYVIRKYQPELLKELTDHGHSPADVLSPVALLRIGPKVLLWRRQRKRTSYREFKTEEWTESLYGRHLFHRPIPKTLFMPAMEEDFLSGAWKTKRMDFARAASFKLWLEMIGMGVA